MYLYGAGILIRAAAYCRVSTDKEDQLNSLESQKRYFYEYITRNPLWELTEIYADEGITGTSTKKRHAFNRMLKDAGNHRFDLILTKEISRFARNTLDSIYYTRRLKSLGIGIIFVNDNINTLEADAELRLTILASIAQEESRKTSERVKWGQKRSMERGVVFGRDLLGYDLRGGKLYVNQAGAEIVKLIFHKFLEEGKGTFTIAKELTEAGIPAVGGSRWHGNVILRILKNEKYCGDLIQKKTYTPDYLKHEKKYNKGQEELICIYNHHEAIINRELFDETQAEIRKRSPSENIKSKYSSRYCFSGLIRCKDCGCSYVSRTKKGKNGSSYRYWRCYEAVLNGRVHIDPMGNKTGCNSYTLKEEELKKLLKQFIQNLKIDKEKLVGSLSGILKKILKEPQDDKELEKLQNKLGAYTIKKQDLIELYLSKEITEDEFKCMKQKYEAEIKRITKSCSELADNCLDTTKVYTDNLSIAQHYLFQIMNGQEWSDAFYRGIIERITVTCDITHSCSEVYGGQSVEQNMRLNYNQKLNQYSDPNQNIVQSGKLSLACNREDRINYSKNYSEGSSRNPYHSNMEVTIHLKNCDMEYNFILPKNN
jgi:DNA invertase Pin-like site-specific DNA recombinase